MHKQNPMITEKLTEQSIQKRLALRRMELDHEYEKKMLQTELDAPKRLGQGEWVSGKALTEVIRLLSHGAHPGNSPERNAG